MTKGLSARGYYLDEAVSATGHYGGAARAEPRVCVVDGWRRFEGDSLVCRECELRMAAQLDALAVAVPLADVVAGAEPTRRGTLNLDAVDLARPGNPHWMAVSAEGIEDGQIPVAAGLGWWAEHWSRREVWSADAASLAGFLKRCLWWACREDAQIGEFATHLRHYYAATRRAIGRAGEPVHYGALCPGCHQRALRRPSGADWVECGRCKRLFEESMLPELARASLYWDMAPGEKLTAAEAAMVTGISFALLRQWHHRGRLVAEIGPWGGTFYTRLEVDWTAAIMEDVARDQAKRREAREARREERLKRLELKAA